MWQLFAPANVVIKNDDVEVLFNQNKLTGFCEESRENLVFRNFRGDTVEIAFPSPNKNIPPEVHTDQKKQTYETRTYCFEISFNGVTTTMQGEFVRYIPPKGMIMDVRWLLETLTCGDRKIKLLQDSRVIVPVFNFSEEEGLILK